MRVLPRGVNKATLRPMQETALESVLEATPEATIDLVPETAPEAVLEATPEAAIDLVPETSPEAVLEATPEAAIDPEPEAVLEIYVVALFGVVVSCALPRDVKVQDTEAEAADAAASLSQPAYTPTQYRVERNKVAAYPYAQQPFSPTYRVPEVYSNLPAAPKYKVQERQEPQWAILRSNLDNNFDGNFQYSFETENGITANAVGTVRQLSPKEIGQAIQGSYSYTSPDGRVLTTYYTADENGFVAQGEHLPVASTVPELPPLIAKSIAYILSQPPQPENQQ